MVEVTGPAAYQGRAFHRETHVRDRTVLPARIGSNGNVIRIGKNARSDMIIGVPMQSSVHAEFDLDVVGGM